MKSLLTFDMKHNGCETDFYPGRLDAVSNRTLEWVVLFEIWQCQHCIEHAFEE